MRIVEDQKIFLLSEDDIPAKLDLNPIEVSCPRCGFIVQIPESIATHHTAEEVKRIREDYNTAMKGMVSAAKRFYGENPQLLQMIKELEEIKTKFLSPDLKPIPGGKREK